MSGNGCATELVSQSEYSPGIVENTEIILFGLIDPLTFRSGSVRPLNHDQLKKTELSVCRTAFCTGKEAWAKIVGALTKNDSTRADEGYLLAECSEIRDILLGSSIERAICVVDHALPDYPAHAHLGYSNPSNEKLKNERAAARGNLLLQFQRRGIFTKWDGEHFGLAE